MIEHLPKETEIVRSLLQQAREDFAPEVHKALSDYVLGEEATEAAAGFVDVLAPKIVELLVRAKAAASLPAFLAGDNIYDENGVPTIVVREGLGVWGTIEEILDDQVIDLYLGTDNQEDFTELYDALDGLESIRFRKLWMSSFYFNPSTIKEVLILDTASVHGVGDLGDSSLNLGGAIERCTIVSPGFSLSGSENNFFCSYPKYHGTKTATLDMSRTAASWRDYRYKTYMPGNPIPQWHWKDLGGWHTVVCSDGTITHDDNGDIVLRQEA